MADNNKLSGLNDTADTTAQFDPEDIEQNKVMGVLAYFGILVLVPMLAAKESAFARFHSNQGLILCIAIIAWAIVHGLLMAILGGLLLPGGWRIYSLIGTILSLIYLIFTVLAIIGIVNALNGKAKELPIIGKYKLLK
jgi:uncharacterized membrane protein